MGADARVIPYESCTFDLVHPYLDEVRDHIAGGYNGLRNPPQIVSARTGLGANTIRALQLDDTGLIWTWMGEAEASFNSRRAIGSTVRVDRFAALKGEVSSSLP